ncbi:Thiosulfate sulfurtransferase RDL1 [Yarrowia sp. C11]|nr:Thiosulfate sulfurtransferase RDL1 [Yarrowia sp. E02]KAG5371670.1 Thiosulfate sulfurtransferase RDL1 [Yarrowia sp. C11]
MKLSTLFSTLFSVTLGVASSAKEYSYSEVKQLSESLVDGTAENTILIDVREPSEFANGYIPGAFNMPLRSQSYALCKTPEEFQAALGFPKPDPSMHVVFYCQSGIRARAAEKQGEQCGYENRGVYLGSWREWEQMEREVGQCR